MPSDAPGDGPAKAGDRLKFEMNQNNVQDDEKTIITFSRNKKNVQKIKNTEKYIMKLDRELLIFLLKYTQYAPIKPKPNCQNRVGNKKKAGLEPPIAYKYNINAKLMITARNTKIDKNLKLVYFRNSKHPAGKII